MLLCLQQRLSSLVCYIYQPHCHVTHSYTYASLLRVRFDFRSLPSLASYTDIHTRTQDTHHTSFRQCIRNGRLCSFPYTHATQTHTHTTQHNTTPTYTQHTTHTSYLIPIWQWIRTGSFLSLASLRKASVRSKNCVMSAPGLSSSAHWMY